MRLTLLGLERLEVRRIRAGLLFVYKLLFRFTALRAEDFFNLSVCSATGVIHTNCFYRQDAAKRQTAGIVFTHRPKIRFFATQGRLVVPIPVKLCRTDGQVRLAVQNFTSIGAGGWECGPKISKISTFW